jgi:hypothetical protein
MSHERYVPAYLPLTSGLSLVERERRRQVAVGIDLREQLIGPLLDGLVGVAAVYQILQQGAIRRRWSRVPHVATA